MQASAAARLGLATSGMKSRVQRGRAKLKELLDACCEVEFAPSRRSQQLPATPGSLHCRTATPVLPRRRPAVNGARHGMTRSDARRAARASFPALHRLC
jgi:hypothetical protein